MSSFVKILITLLLAVLLVSAIWFFSLRVFLADYYYSRTLLTEDWPEVLGLYEKVFFLQPDEPFYRQKFALDLDWGLRFYKDEESKIKIIDLAVGQMDRIREKSFDARIYLARLLSQKAGLTKKEIDFSKAEQAFEKAKQSSPQMARVYTEWCQLKIYEEKWEEAKESCRQAFYLYPPLDHPQMNADHRLLVMLEMSALYERLGEIYADLKDYSKAELMYLQVLKFFPLDRPDIWKKIGDTHYLRGDLEKTIEKNFHGYTLKPDDSFWSLTLALLYQEKGDLEKARFWGENVLKLEPENKKAKLLLNQI